MDKELEIKMLEELEVERLRRREELMRKIEQEESDKTRVLQIMEENRKKLDEQQRKMVCNIILILLKMRHLRLFLLLLFRYHFC